MNGTTVELEATRVKLEPPEGSMYKQRQLKMKQQRPPKLKQGAPLDLAPGPGVRIARQKNATHQCFSSSSNNRTDLESQVAINWLGYMENDFYHDTYNRPFSAEPLYLGQIYTSGAADRCPQGGGNII